MKHIALVLLIAVLALAALFLMVTAPGLPDDVASNFGAGGVAHHRMSRDGYLQLLLVLTLVLPLFIVFCMGVLPRIFPRLTNIPNRDHWLSPGQVDKTMDFLLSAACAMGALIALFVTGVHECILFAHQQIPPRLPQSLFFGLMAAFLVSLVGLIILLYVRFR